VAAGTHAIDNSGGTNSGVVANDAQCAGTFLGQVSKDIWLSYTPAQDGTVTFTTCNIASWDTDLVIYTGGCGALNQVACNGDASGCSNFTSIISNLSVTGGTEYLVRIGSFGTTGGIGEIEIIFTPGGGTPVEVCNNGVDDDGDGWIDDDDPDCEFFGEETGLGATQCNDGVNNDPIEDTDIDVGHAFFDRATIFTCADRAVLLPEAWLTPEIQTLILALFAVGARVVSGEMVLSLGVGSGLGVVSTVLPCLGGLSALVGLAVLMGRCRVRITGKGRF
jgi:hypothetical protein